MNNFDELKKAETLKQNCKEKYPEETVADDDSSDNFITFQKLNKNLCKGILF